jgi:hypothetical protein
MARNPIKAGHKLNGTRRACNNLGRFWHLWHG